MTFHNWISLASSHLRDWFFASYNKEGVNQSISEYYETNPERWLKLLRVDGLAVLVPDSVVYKLSSEPHTMLEFKLIRSAGNGTNKLLMPVNGAWQEIPDTVVKARVSIPFYQNADWVCYHVQVGYTIGSLEITENHVDHFWKWYDWVTK